MNPSQPYAMAYEPYSSSHGHDTNPATEKLTATRNAMQKEGRLPTTAFSGVRIALRVVALALAGSVIGLQTFAATEWVRTRDELVQEATSGFRIRAWPANTDLWPTWINIIAGSIAAVIHIVALVMHLAGLQNLRKSKIYVIVVMLTSLFSIALWVAAALYYKLDNNRGTSHWTVWQWSCSPKRFVNPHVDFPALCSKLNYSFYALIGAGAVELVCLLAFIVMQISSKKRTYKQITPVSMSYSSVTV